MDAEPVTEYLREKYGDGEYRIEVKVDASYMPSDTDFNQRLLELADENKLGDAVFLHIHTIDVKKRLNEFYSDEDACRRYMREVLKYIRTDGDDGIPVIHSLQI